MLETEKYDRVITDLFIPESVEEKIGPVGKKLLEDIEVYEDWAETNRCHLSDLLEEKLAPLGLHIFGIAYSKGIPVMIASDGNRHSGALGFVRYALVQAGATMVHSFMAKFGTFYKENLDQWREAVADFDGRVSSIATYMPGVPEEAKKIFFGF